MKRILALLLASLLIFSLGCENKSLFQYGQYGDDTQNHTSTDIESESADETADFGNSTESVDTDTEKKPFPVPDGLFTFTEDYCTRNLEPELAHTVKTVYNEIIKDPAAASIQPITIRFNFGDSVWLQPVIDYFDSSELFWISFVDALTYERSYIVIKVDFYDFWADPQKNADMLTKMNAKIEEIVGLAEKLSSDWEKALFVHDYLIKNTKYDHDSLAKIKNGDTDPSLMLIHTPYGCLVDGRAVCDGYAKAYTLIMKRMGIECFDVCSETHEWNCIKLDGEYCYVDTTWDDIDSEDADEFFTYGYFGATRSELLQAGYDLTHTSLKLPSCSSDKNSYHKKFNLFLSKYSRSEIDKIFSKQQTRAVSVRFSSLEECNKAYEDLIPDKGWEYLSSLLMCSRIKYCVNESLYILTLYKYIFY